MHRLGIPYDRIANRLGAIQRTISNCLVIPPDIRHRLWLQNSFDELSGLGQEEELTFTNEEQKPWRIKGFIDALKECKNSVEYFDLTMEKLFELVKLPPEDEKILVESMMKELGIKSTSEKLYDGLKG